jgi:hypothetical protein
MIPAVSTLAFCARDARVADREAQAGLAAHPRRRRPRDGPPLMIPLFAAIVNNFTLTLFLGICAFIGVSSKIDTALRMGAADTFVLVLTAVAVWFLNRFVLVGAPYLRIIAFIVVIAGLVQIVEMIIKKASPTLFREPGIYFRPHHHESWRSP